MEWIFSACTIFILTMKMPKNKIIVTIHPNLSKFKLIKVFRD